MPFAESVSPRRAPPMGGVRLAIVVIAASVAIGCDVNAALERLTEARRLAADVLVQFTKAADAANRAVMADTDEKSVAFAREAEQTTEAVQRDVDALASMLQGLSYSDEGRLL